MKTKIKNIVDSIFEDIVAWREHIHSHPELSFKEESTAKFVSSKLIEFGISRPYRMAKTGVVALIEGRNPESKCIALRADLDALPISEENEVPYKSKVDGCMHACGHDVHTACLLGAAKVLQSLRNQFNGTIKLIFQPGEELLPGGASLLIDEGVLDNPKVDNILALHVLPSLNVGFLGFRPGLYMASCDEMYLNVIGKGGHAALPSKYLNPIPLMSELLLKLNNFVKTESNGSSYIFVFGDLHADGATNIIPEKIVAKGTFRTFDESWRIQMHIKLESFVDQFLHDKGFQGALKIVKGYPFLNNDKNFTNQCNEFAKDYLGKEMVQEIDVRMTAEDFSFYSQKVPACFFRLGVGNKSKGIIYDVHNPNFDIDKRALGIGAGIMAYLAIKSLD